MGNMIFLALMGFAGDDYCGTPWPGKWPGPRRWMEVLIGAVGGIAVGSAMNSLAPEAGMVVNGMAAFAGGKLAGMISGQFSGASAA